MTHPASIMILSAIFLTALDHLTDIINNWLVTSATITSSLHTDKSRHLGPLADKLSCTKSVIVFACSRQSVRRIGDRFWTGSE